MDIRTLQRFKDEPDCVKHGLRILAENRQREEDRKRLEEKKRNERRIDERAGYRGAHRYPNYGSKPRFP